MDDNEAVAWLHRSAGFGLAPADLAAAVQRGPDKELDRLCDPAAAGIAAPADPWDDAQLPLDSKSADARLHAVDMWLTSMVNSPQPLHDRMAWLWHGHFVSALDKVRIARLMVNQIRLFRSFGMGSFVNLLGAVTIDPAMLVYLDGRRSTGDSPNENYAREVMELFTLGVGNYDENDVQAAAKALTGWTIVADDGTAQYRPKRHDDRDQVFLGRTKVHNVDTVVAAISAQPAMPVFIARTMCQELLGTAPDALVDKLAGEFAAAEFDIKTLVKSTLRAGLDGTRDPVVMEPVRWVVAAQRVTGAELKPRLRLMWLRSAGQLPLVPPNVAGWPGGAAWFGTSAVVARANLAASVASATSTDAPILAAADAGGDLLAEQLGLTATFTASTAAVLAKAANARDRLALALCSPEFLFV